MNVLCSFRSVSTSAAPSPTSTPQNEPVVGTPLVLKHHFISYIYALT